MAKAIILLVQNSQTQGNGTQHSLESSGYEVVLAGNSVSALSAVRRRTIDLILIDVSLPDSEGGELCSFFRQRQATNDLPIILLTVRGYLPAMQGQGVHGPDDFLAKPYSLVELDARITASLNTKKLRSELDRKNRQLDEAQSQAIIDPSTGLYNRPQFHAMFSKEFKRSVRYKQPVSCMRIDLDDREDGRSADEGLVKAIIGLIQKTIREVDTAAWWTGEGFILLVPNTTRDQALQAAMRILVAVAEHPFTWSDSKNVTISIGVAGLPDDTIDTEAKLIEAADAALCNARQFMLAAPVQITKNGSLIKAAEPLPGTLTVAPTT